MIDVSTWTNYPTVKFMFIEVSSPNDRHSVLVSFTYKPPNSSYGTKLESDILASVPNFSNIIITGDYSTNL